MWRCIEPIYDYSSSAALVQCSCEVSLYLPSRSGLTVACNTMASIKARPVWLPGANSVISSICRLMARVCVSSAIGYAFSTYGEIAACWVQDVALVALIARYSGIDDWRMLWAAVAFGVYCWYLTSAACTPEVLRSALRHYYPGGSIDILIYTSDLALIGSPVSMRWGKITLYTLCKRLHLNQSYSHYLRKTFTPGAGFVVLFSA